MLDVSAFALQPRRFGRVVRIGASINDFGNIVAKVLSDIAQSFRSTTIFDRIVKQGADRFDLIRAVLKRNGSHTKNMRDERNSRFLARLITMNARRINQGFFEFLRQLHAIELYVKDVDGKPLQPQPRHCSGGLRLPICYALAPPFALENLLTIENLGAHRPPLQEFT